MDAGRYLYVYVVEVYADQFSFFILRFLYFLDATNLDMILLYTYTNVSVCNVCVTVVARVYNVYMYNMIPITSCHELVLFKSAAAMCTILYCIILLSYIILLWSRRFRERLRIFIFYSHYHDTLFILSFWSTKTTTLARSKIRSGGEPPTIIITNRALVSGSPRHVVTIY